MTLMNESARSIADASDELLQKLVVDALRRIIMHYGHWFAEVQHQVGTPKAIEIEQAVWDVSLNIQLQRMAKSLGFALEDGLPAALKALPRETLLDLLKNLAGNWLANDGIWFQAVEKTYGMLEAKRCNDTCWTRFSPFEAARIRDLLGLPPNGGIAALQRALAFRMYALVNEQSIEELDDGGIIFRMNNCRVQDARRRRGLPDYACKSAGMVEYPRFAQSIDDRIRTECVGCPPDAHPAEWFCAWKFTLVE